MGEFDRAFAVGEDGTEALTDNALTYFDRLLDDATTAGQESVGQYATPHTRQSARAAAKMALMIFCKDEGYHFPMTTEEGVK